MCRDTNFKNKEGKEIRNICTLFTEYLDYVSIYNIVVDTSSSSKWTDSTLWCINAMHLNIFSLIYRGMTALTTAAHMVESMEKLAILWPQPISVS